MDRYFKNELGLESSSISSAHQLLEAVDELESGMGMKSWKAGFVLFWETVLQSGTRTGNTCSW